MNNQIIENIAAKNGWNVFVKELPDRVSFDFQRKTLSGVSFCFTAEMKDGSMKYLVQEIVSFVDAIEPETCAVEWLIKSGASVSVSAGGGRYGQYPYRGMVTCL